jgi:hypothetical protein
MFMFRSNDARRIQCGGRRFRGFAGSSLPKRWTEGKSLLASRPIKRLGQEKVEIVGSESQFAETVDVFR